MENIKEAFSRIKEDILTLDGELAYLREVIEETNRKIVEISGILINLYERKNKTEKQEETTHKEVFTTDKALFKPLKSKNKGISIGNEGVSTDRQTNRQTDKQTQKEGFYTENHFKSSVKDAANFLDSLEGLRKEMKKKIKSLTRQETLVFSEIYLLEEEENFATYRKLSSRLNLTESSIRDYVGRLISKGIPLLKEKHNNKEVWIKIDTNLRKIANLASILKFRDL